MGCNNCKQKKRTQKSQKKSTKKETENKWDVSEKVAAMGGKTIPLIPGVSTDGAFSGNVLLKLVTFVILIAALPLIFVVLLLQVFTAFFLPNFTSKGGLMGVIKKIIKKYSTIRKGRAVKRREKEFGDNMSYDDLDIYSVEENRRKNYKIIIG